MVKWLLGTVLVAVPAFPLIPVLFPPDEGDPVPMVGQLPYFLFLGASDAILLDLGISFSLCGYPMLRKMSFDSKATAWEMYLSIGYLMTSWWPHLGMHASDGLDLQGLLVIDYLFHLPLEIAGVVLAYCAFASFGSWIRQSPLHGQQELGGEDRLAESRTQ